MYFIKDGYQENTLANSFDELTNNGCENFWTVQRLETAAFYQHHVYSHASKIFDDKKYKSIVDVGCGPAVKTGKFFADIADEICLIDQRSIKHVALANVSKGSFISENLEKPASSKLKQYDMVLCSDVVEHLVNPLPCLRLLKSLASDNGTIIISTPERDNLRGVKCMRSMHKSPCTRMELS
jgi:2-polyprenyl-3-methyl-5-hydroxy-6-metoxy-1,4-benzoquinol methylase